MIENLQRAVTIIFKLFIHKYFLKFYELCEQTVSFLVLLFMFENKLISLIKFNKKKRLLHLCLTKHFAFFRIKTKSNYWFSSFMSSWYFFLYDIIERAVYKFYFDSSTHHLIPFGSSNKKNYNFIQWTETYLQLNYFLFHEYFVWHVIKFITNVTCIQKYNLCTPVVYYNNVIGTYVYERMLRVNWSCKSNSFVCGM